MITTYRYFFGRESLRGPNRQKKQRWKACSMIVARREVVVATFCITSR